MTADQVSDEMAQITLRRIQRDEAEDRDKERYEFLMEKLTAMEFGR